MVKTFIISTLLLFFVFLFIWLISKPSGKDIGDMVFIHSKGGVTVLGKVVGKDWPMVAAKSCDGKLYSGDVSYFIPAAPDQVCEN